MQGIRSKLSFLTHALELHIRYSRIAGVHLDVPAPTFLLGIDIHIALNDHVAGEQDNFGNSINTHILKTLLLSKVRVIKRLFELNESLVFHTIIQWVRCNRQLLGLKLLVEAIHVENLMM